MKLVHIFCILSVTSVTCFGVPDSHLQVFRLCDKTLLREEYDLSSSVKCPEIRKGFTTTCDAKIFSAPAAYSTIPVIICKTTITVWKTWNFFFGAKTESSALRSGRAVPSEECLQWSTSGMAGKYGVLTTDNENLRSTKNEVKFTYRWPSSDEGTVVNVAVLKTNIVYDHLQRSLKSPIASLVTCEYSRGHCSLGDRVFVWHTSKMIECPKSLVKNDVKIIMHHDKNRALARIEIPSLASSIHSWTDCGIMVHKCFKNQTFCTHDKLIIEPQNCKEVLKFGQEPINRSEGAGKLVAIDAPVVEMLQEVNDRLVEQILQLVDKSNALECQLQEMLTKIFNMLGKRFPSEVLTQIIGKPIQAVSSGDILVSVSCHDVLGYLSRSLVVNDTIFSSRPIVKYLDVQNNTRYSQYLPGGFIQDGLILTESYFSGRISTFKLSNAYVRYENYTLSHSNVSIEQLSPHLKPFKLPTTDLDLEGAMHKFESMLPQYPYTDYDSLLQQMNQANQLKARFSQVLGQLSDDGQNILSGNSDPIEALNAAVSKGLVWALSALSPSWVSMISSISMILSMSWGMIWTACFIRDIVLMVYHKLRQPRVYDAFRRLKNSWENSHERAGGVPNDHIDEGEN